MSDLNSRQAALVEAAREKGFVTVEDLAERLGVTHQTVRRDINFLCEKGVLTRFHGGAAFRSSVTNLPYEARQDQLTAEKRAIAALVAADIHDGSSVFIDIGTTAEAVAEKLLERRNLRIVTNNINVASRLAKKDDFQITICPGTLRNRDLAITGASATEFIRRFQVDYVILGVVAIGADGSILDFDVDEIEATQAIIGCGREVLAVVDHTKFGRQAVVKVGHISQLTRLYSDAPIPSEWNPVFSENQVGIVHPKP